MSRRVIAGLAVTLAAVAVALVAVVILRTTIAQYVLERDLRARDIPLERVTVSELWFDTAALTDVRLGTDGEVTADALRVDYDLSGLMQGSVQRVVLERPTVRLDLTGDGPPFGSLQPLFETEGGGDAAAPSLPPITIVNGLIRARTPIGPMTAGVDGTVLISSSGDAAPPVQADLTLALRGEVGYLAGTTEIAVQDNGQIEGNLSVNEGNLARAGWQADGISGGARFVWAEGRPTALDATLALEGGAFEGTAFRDARVTIEVDEVDAEGTVILTAADESFTAELHGVLNDYLGRPGARLEAELAAGVHAPLWPLLRLPAPSEGRVTARLLASGQLPPLSQLIAADASAVPAEPKEPLHGRLDITLDKLTFPDRAADITGAVIAEIDTVDRALRLRLKPESRLAAAQVTPRWLSALGLPEEVAASLEQGVEIAVDDAPADPVVAIWHPAPDGGGIEATGGIRLASTAGTLARASIDGIIEISGDGGVRWLALDQLALHLENLRLGGSRLERAAISGSASGAPEALVADLDISASLSALDVAGVQAEAATIALPVHLQPQPSGLSLSLRKPGRLTAERLTYGTAVSATAPVTAEVPVLDLRLDTLPEEGQTWRHTIRLEPGSIRFQIPGGGGTAFDARIDRVTAQGTLTAGGPYEGEITSEIPRLRLVGQDFALDGLVLVATPGAEDGKILSIERGTLRNVAKQPYLAPFYLWGGLSQAGDELRFSVGGRTAKGAGRLNLDGSHDLATGRGTAALALRPVSFAPGGAQPAAVFPTLEELKSASGEVRAHADFSWTGKGVRGSAQLRADSLSFLVPGASVRNLDLDLTLSSLFPPGSRPDQRLTIGEINPGLPITDVSVLFEVLRGTRPRAKVSTAQFGVAGGRISTRDVLIDPAATRRALTLNVDRLDLANVFDLLDIKGVSGTGQLSGAIPIALDGSDVGIQNGRLSAIAPGVLHLQSDTVEKALGAAGESADLIMRALGNFRYDTLTLDIATPSATQAQVTLVLEGNNPDVLEGRPFRFNVNLETDPTRLLATLRELSQISQRALRRLWMVER